MAKAEPKRGTPPPSASQSKYVQHQVMLPLPHMEMLQTEADLLGVSRAAFLIMLLKRRREGLTLERPPSAPQYQFKTKQFEKMDRFVWYVSKDIEPLLRIDCLEMGNVSLQAWIVTVLNQYVKREGAGLVAK